MKIIVVFRKSITKPPGDYIAFFAGDKGTWGQGNNDNEAINSLFRTAHIEKPDTFEVERVIEP